MTHYLSMSCSTTYASEEANMGMSIEKKINDKKVIAMTVTYMGIRKHVDIIYEDKEN